MFEAKVGLFITSLQTFSGCKDLFSTSFRIIEYKYLHTLKAPKPQYNEWTVGHSAVQRR